MQETQYCWITKFHSKDTEIPGFRLMLWKHTEDWILEDVLINVCIWLKEGKKMNQRINNQGIPHPIKTKIEVRLPLDFHFPPAIVERYLGAITYHIYKIFGLANTIIPVRCLSVSYSPRSRECQLSGFDQTGSRIVYDSEHDYYENLIGRNSTCALPQ